MPTQVAGLLRNTCLVKCGVGRTGVGRCRRSEVEGGAHVHVHDHESDHDSDEYKDENEHEQYDESPLGELSEVVLPGCGWRNLGRRWVWTRAGRPLLLVLYVHSERSDAGTLKARDWRVRRVSGSRLGMMTMIMSA